MRINSAVVAALLLASPSALHAAEPPAPKRPNILFLLADDWAWPHASCLGTPGIKTPTFDRLAREGVMFRNAHVAAPSCSPSRAAMLTGQWPWRLGPAANLQAFIPATFPVYPDLLEQAGYWVGFSGKGYGPGNNQGRPHNAAGPEFKGFVEFLGARPATQPFCFWLGSHFPHRPYPRGSGVHSGIDPATVIVPPYLVDSAAVRSDICDYFFAAEAFDRQAAEAIAALEKSGELNNTLIVMSGDNGWPFPRSKATCYDSGTHQPLAVRWGARIQPGRVVDDFVSLADLAPTFLQAAGLTPPPGMSARSFLNVLLAKGSGQIDPTRDHVLTCMERHVINARVDGGQRDVGYPMRTLITHQFHYIRNFQPQRWPAGDPPSGPPPGFDAYAKNTGAGYADVDAGPAKAWILTHTDDQAFARGFGKRPACEIFDLRKDPFELHNVAEDPAYATNLKELNARLMAELKASADPRLAGEELDRSPGAKPGQSP
ncbi:MAG: sulfatase [Verrucomicrobia bacterium]|nr:MAG: sulfatase [Verrucomicrobiota bacterium]